MGIHCEVVREENLMMIYSFVLHKDSPYTFSSILRGLLLHIIVFVELLLIVV